MENHHRFKWQIMDTIVHNLPLDLCVLTNIATTIYLCQALSSFDRQMSAEQR